MTRRKHADPFRDVTCLECGLTAPLEIEAYHAGWSLTECPVHRRARIARIAAEKESRMRANAEVTP